LSVLEHLDLFLDRRKPRAAQLEQLGATTVAVEQLIQRQLAVLHALNQTFELGQRVFVTRWDRLGGRGAARHFEI